MSFIPIPAIDIMGGACVRLEQGDFGKATTYSDDPPSVAASLAGAGVGRIHVVDLDGAKQGRRVNAKVIRRAIKAASDSNPSVKVQVGGGLRTVDDINGALNDGASFVVLGTAAIADATFLEQVCKAAPGSVLLGLDAKGGTVYVSGWTESTSFTTSELAAQAAGLGVAGIIHTDIDRDGVMAGANVHATAELADAVTCPVFASGGVRSIQDLVELSKTMVAGAIVGKALYSGTVSAKELAGFCQP